VSTGLRWLGVLFLGLVVAGMTAWCAGAIYYSRRDGSAIGAVLAVGFVAAIALAFLLLPRRWRTLNGFLAAFALVVAWWLWLPASNDRDWLPEVAVTPWASRDGDLVTVHGVRNFDYRTETDFTPRWEDRTYDLRALDSGDLIAVYWAGKAIAHIMVSFGFAGRDYLAVSIETRKARGQTYSTIAGFFKQYELVYVAADERDVIGVRTTYRQPQEDVYVYRIQGSRENLRRVFLDYVKTMNDMRDHPSVLQHAHHQLHHDGADAFSRQPGVPAVVLEDPPVRIPSAVRVRARETGADSAVRRAGATSLGQPARPCGRPRSDVLAAHPRGGAMKTRPYDRPGVNAGPVRLPGC
jgi:hypothetical protein